MPVSDLCSKNLISISPDSTLKEAAKLMRENQVGALVVCEADGADKPVGFLTDRDIVMFALAEERDLSTPVKEVMSENIVQIGKNEGIAEMVDQMESQGVRRVVVTEDDGSVCGVVSSDDVLQLIAREINGLGRIAQQQSMNA